MGAHNGQHEPLGLAMGEALNKQHEVDKRVETKKGPVMQEKLRPRYA